MKFNFLRTRRGKLKERLEIELKNQKPSIIKILEYIDDYEKENLRVIKKLKRKKEVDVRKINGAIKQTIDAHGPITKNLIGSASKRIFGALLEEKSENKLIKFLKWIIGKK